MCKSRCELNDEKILVQFDIKLTLPHLSLMINLNFSATVACTYLQYNAHVSLIKF